MNSGNLQSVIYDLTNEWVYIAYGYEEYIDGKRIRTEAYKRPYVGLNLKEIFKVKLDEEIKEDES